MSSRVQESVIQQERAIEAIVRRWFACKAQSFFYYSHLTPLSFIFCCSVYNNIHHPSKLAGGADLYCFKHKIEPKWEDPICANGGKWTVTFPKGKSDTPWLFTVVPFINVRARQDKISIWTKNASNEAAQVCLT
ncbi:Eukaryotic translation initiation factor 4E-1 [Linum perenne]